MLNNKCRITNLTLYKKNKKQLFAGLNLTLACVFNWLPIMIMSVVLA